MVRGLILVIHQRDGPKTQHARREDLRIRIVTDSKIEATLTRPRGKRPRAAHQAPSFRGHRTPGMFANNLRLESGGPCEWNRFRKLSRGHLYLVTVGDKPVG